MSFVALTAFHQCTVQLWNEDYPFRTAEFPCLCCITALLLFTVMFLYRFWWWNYIFIQCSAVLITGRTARRAPLPVLFLLMGWFFRFSLHRGDTLHWSRWNLAGRSDGPLLPAKFHLDRLRGARLRPQNFDILSILLPLRGQIPCVVFTKYVGFMRTLDLHDFARCGWFISISDKIMNNLRRWGHFRWPLAAKLLIGSKKS